MPKTMQKNTTLAATRRDALLGAVALPAAAIATQATAVPAVQLSPDFRELRALITELSAVEAFLGNRAEGKKSSSAAAVLRDDLSRRIEVAIERIHARPVRGLSDLLERAAAVLYWSDSGLETEAWADPVAHLTSTGTAATDDPMAIAGAHLAAAVFALARQGGANV